MENLVLAYIGDAALEIYVRIYLTDKFKNVSKLTSESIKLVSAKGQKKTLEYLFENNVLYEKEIEIYKKGRNVKVRSFKKDVITYKISTGYEAMLGYLYLNDKDRFEEIVKEVFKYYESLG